jgi:hypothetical protein
MTQTAKTLLKMLIAGAVGGIIGGALVTHHTASDDPLWLMVPRGHVDRHCPNLFLQHLLERRRQRQRPHPIL